MNFGVNKKTQNFENTLSDLSKRWGNEALPIDDKFTERFGSDWRKNPLDLHKWYCKTMWKHSTVDLASPNKLTAPMIGMCADEGDGEIHQTHKKCKNKCEKKIVPEFIESM